MASKDETWIKLSRSLLTSDVFSSETCLKVWIWCLLKATHRKHDQLVGNTVVHLSPGQFVTGRNKASEELHITVDKYRHAIKNLTKMGNISTNVTNKYTVITVENWASFQSKPPTKSPTNPQQTPNKPPQTRMDKNVQEKEFSKKLEDLDGEAYEAECKRRSRAKLKAEIEELF